MLPRVLEPEAMDTTEEARDYDAMDHAGVNARFVADLLEARGGSRGGRVLDVGSGPGRIPIALCNADPAAFVVALDLAGAMLVRAQGNVARAGLDGRIGCVRGDAKRVPFGGRAFEAVVSNTIVHHVPVPAPALAEMVRLVAAGGTLFVRDLVRPATGDEVAHLVATYAGSEAPAARALFEASLHAALTVDEVRDIVGALGLPKAGVTMSSDRHWTWTWRRPAAR